MALCAPKELCRRLIRAACLYQPVVRVLAAAFLAFLPHDGQVGLVVLYDFYLFFLRLGDYFRFHAAVPVALAAVSAHKVSVLGYKHTAAMITEFHLITRQRRLLTLCGLLYA